MTEIESVCNYFSSKDILMGRDNEWLKACIEWYKSENEVCSLQQIQDFAYNQLLLADLNAVAQACLPPTVNEARTTKLQGKYFLQINYFIDVGQSAYSQYQTIQKKSLVNLEVTEEKQQNWEPKPNRMLKMEMTDGVHIVYGMEYSQITKLNPMTVPGTKVIVLGPVECRSGVIMLQERNVVVLGGEVDSLYETNHMNSLIARTLKLDSNLIPILDEASEANQQPFHTPMLDQNELPVTSQVSTTATRSMGTALTLASTNSEALYNQQLEINDDYFADSDIFLNVPVDVTDEASTGNKKRVSEIEGKVTAFKSKLLIKDNNWFIIVRIHTDRDSIKATFDPDLLDRVIGFSPTELNSKENEIAVNPAIKEKMNKMLKRGQQVIKDLKCSMTLIHEEGVELPVIIAISDDNAFYSETFS